ncbi:MAG: DsrE family protein [Nanoarchaeota archaeon]|nr:DsrE family protein [Nanoarchaeota archaeon]
MQLGIIISQIDPETVWNAYRLGIFALEQRDKVKIFLLGRGVESEIEDPKFNVKEQVTKYVEAGGEIYACGTCMKSREMKSTNTCPLSTMKDLYNLIKESDKVLTF